MQTEMIKQDAERDIQISPGVLALEAQAEAALWHCARCGSWWCSQPTVEPTNFMLELPVMALERLGWENFRGWRLGGTPHVATCPECAAIARKPVYGTASAGTQLQQDLAALLSPVLAGAR